MPFPSVKEVRPAKNTSKTGAGKGKRKRRGRWEGKGKGKKDDIFRHEE